MRDFEFKHARKVVCLKYRELNSSCTYLMTQMLWCTLKFLMLQGLYWQRLKFIHTLQLWWWLYLLCLKKLYYIGRGMLADQTRPRHHDTKWNRSGPKWPEHQKGDFSVLLAHFWKFWANFAQYGAIFCRIFKIFTCWTILMGKKRKKLKNLA